MMAPCRLTLNTIISLSAFTTPLDGFSLFNEDGELRVFFPNNSFVTNTTLTHTNKPRGHSPGAPHGNDHIACYGSSQTATTLTWHNSSGVRLEDCGGRCRDCGGRCVHNGGIGVDKPDLRITDIHMYTDSPAYVNQDLECQMFGIGGTSAFIGVYLKDGGKFDNNTQWQIALYKIIMVLLVISFVHIYIYSSLSGLNCAKSSNCQVKLHKYNPAATD